MQSVPDYTLVLVQQVEAKQVPPLWLFGFSLYLSLSWLKYHTCSKATA